MSVTSPDFESGAYTNFATPALDGHNSLLPRAASTAVAGKTNALSLADTPGRTGQLRRDYLV